MRATVRSRSRAFAQTRCLQASIRGSERDRTRANAEPCLLATPGPGDEARPARAHRGCADRADGDLAVVAERPSVVRQDLAMNFGGVPRSYRIVRGDEVEQPRLPFARS